MKKIWSSYAGTDILSVGSANYVWNNQMYTGSALAYVANKDLSWETTNPIGKFRLDLTLFKSLNFSGDFYIKETSDILMQLPVSSTFGFTEDPWQNAGKVRNIGAEFSVSYSKMITRALELNGGFNLSFNKNEILDLKGLSLYWMIRKESCCKKESRLIRCMDMKWKAFIKVIKRYTIIW